MRTEKQINDAIILIETQRSINKKKIDLNDDPLISESLYEDMVLLNDRLLAKAQTLRWVLEKTNVDLSDEKIEI